MSKPAKGKGGLPVGKAGRSPTRNKNRQKAPGPKKLNQAGYGSTSSNRKGPRKGPNPGNWWWQW